VLSQISGGNIEEVKTVKEKKVSSFNTDSLTGSSMNLTGFIQHSYRYFEDNSVYDKHALLVDETPLTTGGASFTIVMPLTNSIGLELGATYFTHGEQYNYQDPLTDSTFFYSNAYHQLGIPLKLRYTYGNKLQVFGFAGITPLNILRIQYKNSYRTAEGSEIEVPTKTIKNDFTAFNLMASAGVGITYYLKQFGFTLYPEYRRHLMNTYSEDTFKRKHFMYGFALNAGFSVRF
jgi:hypothetical protein